MATEGAIVSADVNGWNVTSNTATKESIAALGKKDGEPPAEEKPDPSRAASELGKLGGEASAKARAKAAKEAKKQQAELGLEAENTEEAPEKVEAKVEESEDEKPEEKPLGKPRDDPRARMLEATRKEAEAKRALAAERVWRERERAELQKIREEVEALKRSTKPAESESRPAPQEAKGKPKAEDYDDYEAYLDARDEWNQAQWTEKQQKQAQASALEREIDQTFRSFVEATADIREQIKDTIGQLASSFQLQPGQKETGENWIANELIFSPENARTLALYLHEHPDELQRIAALQTPRAVSREMAKLEARLEAATAGNSSESEPAVSKAPPPIKPVSGASYVAEGDAYKPGMSLDDYARNWNKTRRLQR